MAGARCRGRNNSEFIHFLLAAGAYAEGNKEGLKAFDRLPLIINTVYEKHNYWGEHACHIASVIYGDDEFYLKLLIERGADPFIHRARGTFFDPDESIGSFYMGETVLAFAAVMGHHRIVDYLIHDVGVDPNMVDYNGNNVLHVLCWYGYVGNKRGIDIPRALSQFNSADAANQVPDDSPALGFETELQEEEEEEENQDDVIIKEIVVGEIYHQLETGIRPSKFAGEVSREELDSEAYHPHRVDDTQTNNDRMTPLILAVHRSQSLMVEAILKYKSRTLWTYGASQKTRVSLSELDTFNDTITMNHTDGALALAIRNQNFEILNIPVFHALLDAKWILYAQRIFYFRFWFNVLYMVIFTVALALVPNGQTYLDPGSMSAERLYNYELPPKTSQECIRLVLEIVLVASNIFNFVEITNQAKLLKGKVFTGFSKHHTIIKYINFLLFAAIVALRLLRWNQAESVALTLYAVLGWMQMLYYFRGFRELGPLSMVFTKIIRNDVYKFLMITGIVLAGFGSALWLQMAPYGALNAAAGPAFNGTYPGFANPDDADWKDLMPGGLIWSIRLFFAQGAYDDFRNGSSTQFAMILFMLFFFTVNIILLNLFIGMVNSTFGQVLNDSEKEYYLAWASLIMEMDELLLAKYYKKLEESRIKMSKPPAPPITRIGIPRKTSIFNSKVVDKKVADVKVRQKMLVAEGSGEGSGVTHKRHSYLPGAGPKGAVAPTNNTSNLKVDSTKEEIAKYFDYDLYLQFNGNDAKPKRIIASLDPASPLSEVAHENSLSGTRRIFQVNSRRTRSKNHFTIS
ncbi:hypothetical protein BDR26DRAFT_120693 [Obelidium mucronatum]|nr:hypothetical protein BDR26DRAFT_120693 [Obelidium mucronatum]